MSPAGIEMQLVYSIGPSFQLELRCRGSHSFRSTAAPYCCESITLHLASRSHVRRGRRTKQHASTRSSDSFGAL
ncbi:unnamed protein product [Ixodes persulcatus]